METGHCQIGGTLQTRSDLQEVEREGEGTREGFNKVIVIMHRFKINCIGISRKTHLSFISDAVSGKS